MTNLAIWSSGITLESLILFRSVKTGIIRIYPFFCVYLGCVLIGDVALVLAYKLLPPSAYQTSFWIKEFVCVIAGYAVVMEIIERAFAHYEGPKKLGRNAALITFAAIVGFTVVQAAVVLAPSVRSAFDVEANLRGAELVLLSILIAAIFYYRIPIGKNLKAIILGYGFCTAAVAMNEAVGSFVGGKFSAAFSRVWSYSFFVSLLVWVVGLWSYEPSEVPQGQSQMDGNYMELASRTRAAVATMRGHLRKAGR
jgi:hypothetical protein